MKIAFVGAQGTGKTTLVNKLKVAMPWMHVYDLSLIHISEPTRPY